MPVRFLPGSLLLLVVMGCGDSPGRVKGRVVENGQPKDFPPMQASVTFDRIGPDGKPDTKSSYTAILNKDGTFEVIVSGGELPSGTYAVSISATGKENKLFKGFNAAETKVRREIKSGLNDIQIDLAKPEG
jgi:hypothetical protein